MGPVAYTRYKAPSSKTSDIKLLSPHYKIVSHSTYLVLLLAERVLEEELGPGRRKPVFDAALRKELLEADSNPPTVPEVEVSNSKPTDSQRISNQ